jgi:hypothetical protein
VVDAPGRDSDGDHARSAEGGGTVHGDLLEVEVPLEADALGWPDEDWLSLFREYGEFPADGLDVRWLVPSERSSRVCVRSIVVR